MKLGAAEDSYRLKVGDMQANSTAGDSLNNAEYGNGFVQDGAPFSTYDHDRDQWGPIGNNEPNKPGLPPSCAQVFKGYPRFFVTYN